MKNIRNSILAIGVATIAMAFTTAVKTTLQVDPEKSQLTWLGEKVTGEHTGHIKIKDGSVELTNGKLSGGEFTIDMSSITCTDLEDEGYNQKLVGHLKSEDFFGVEKHPVSKFKITSATDKGGDKYDLKGNLTIKGKTLPIEFPATVTTDGKTLKAQAKIEVDRTKYDIRYGSGSFFDNLGDKTIDDIFTLDVYLVAKK